MSQDNLTPSPTEVPAAAPAPASDLYTTRIVGVKFRSVGKVFDYDARDFKFSRGDFVVCDLEDKGQMLGQVSKPTVAIPPDILKLRLNPVLRPANHNDIKNRERFASIEKEGLSYIRALVTQRMISMHIIAVEIPLGGKKALVYFSSEQRVDFRELVKELVHYFKMRVELRQLGARDETKFIGGIGPCGQETCCSRFLTTFHKVSTKMAKDQGLSLTPTKVAGNCGRLKCCLAYEQPVYAEARKTLPKLGNCVKCTTGDGGGSACGVAAKLEILKQVVTVRFDDGTIENVPAERIIEQWTMGRNKPEASKIIRDDEILEEDEIAKEEDNVTAVVVADEE